MNTLTTALRICVFAAIVTATSCVGPKKVNRWVAQQYGTEIKPTAKKSNFVTVTSSVPATGPEPSETERKTHDVLPLLFYWKWTYSNYVALNPQIAVNSSTTTFMNYGKKLASKMPGKRLTLNIDKIPARFAIDDKVNMIWLIYAIQWEKITVTPSENDMAVTYTIYDSDNSVAKTGTLTANTANIGVTKRMYQRLKFATQDYMMQYDAEITRMSKSIIDQLEAEL